MNALLTRLLMRRELPPPGAPRVLRPTKPLDKMSPTEQQVFWRREPLLTRGKHEERR